MAEKKRFEKYFFQKFHLWFKNSKKMEKSNWEKIQTHMCNFLFGASVLTLNYKYYQVTPSVKIFFSSSCSSRCRSKEYPPPFRGSKWGGYSPKCLFERDVLKRFNPIRGYHAWLPPLLTIFDDLKGG